MPIRSAVIFCWLALAAGSAAAQAIPASPIVKASLLVDASHLVRGEPIAAGVHFVIPPDWHIYWRNPGDSGIPTTLQWTALPKEIQAGDVAWPTPHAVETSGLINYGYDKEVTLLVPLIPLTDGVHGTVALQARWLVCRDVCIPENAALTAPLAPDPAARPLLEAARAAVPEILAGDTGSYRITPDAVRLRIPLAALHLPAQPTITAARFYPLEDGIAANAGRTEFRVDTSSGQLSLGMKRGSADAAHPWHGVLALETDRGPVARELAIPLSTAPESATGEPSPVASLLAALLLAFIGGLLLNAMPCVLPILALKALAVVRKAEASRAAAARQGIAYTAGVVVSFLAIAGVMLSLRATGAAVGWGFQLQNGWVVGLLAAVMLLVAANLLGLFALPVLFGTRAHGIDESSRFGSFFTGALAVLVATPCSAPFMATALGATLTLPWMSTLLVFVALGLGMASPFLLISFWPAARRLIPRPGAWMHRFKQWLALPMLLTALWLLSVLWQMHIAAPMPTSAAYEPYSAQRLSTLRAKGTPVFVDATAAWCLTCKVNERTSLRTTAMQEYFHRRHVITLVADWTRSDPAITAYLGEFGRNGVPLYVYYPPHGEPAVLPQILTPELVRQTIK